MNVHTVGLANESTSLSEVAGYALASITRRELREIAIKHNVKRGQNKQDTIRNLITNGKVKVRFSIE